MSRSGMSAKGPTQRMLRVSEIIRKALSEALSRGDVRHPLLEKTVVSISEVRMSPDLKIATAYVMPLGGQDAGAIVKALAEDAKLLRGKLGNKLGIRFTPNLRFQIDDSFDTYAKVDSLLRSPEVAKDIDKARREAKHADERDDEAED